MQRLSIDLGERSYEILIGSGLRKRAGEFLKAVFNPSRVVIITHPSINSLYGKEVVANFKDQGWTTDVIEVPEGESSKNLGQAEKLYDRLLELNCDRKSVLVALGGGVIGDLVGFVAATYQRGIPFIQMPTTLLSQVDSSVGGKTAVNHPKGKNMIGAFYQPRLVLADLETLRTLPSNEYRAGLAEIVKYGVISDAKLFEFLETQYKEILNLDQQCLSYIIETSCAIKAEVVEKDERESHYRMILNFGHTLGHAIESLTNYSRFIHGEAVAIGMVRAAALSQSMGKCSEDVPRRLEALLKNLGLPVEMPELDSSAVIESLYHDKKTMDHKIKFILVKEIGSIEIVDQISEAEIIKVL
ncbi:MAG: 3-dehydroquinate synthase [Nitrospina sp.]|jgi:3-dehydroquinate synthase|nr:3-dehydroquinate synthase [Nitrospina sp.]MBT3508302.1 3-dehydroquinate synthase [Nitrospina sp.]MBT3874756.1 3-dehydroquinate synthase [Nitrospina sp.]MBT4049490.1 3-dehydroquinate synthase [Nitrospina sp.]MBT4558424.1 3-dehydroquinate synthase [Nitrospina sp.]